MIQKQQLPRSRAAQGPESEPGAESGHDVRTVALDRTRLLAHRRGLGLSQAMLAVQSGVSKDTLSRAENGIPVRLGMANAIASTYKVPLKALLPDCSDPADLSRKMPSAASDGETAGLSETTFLTESLAGLGEADRAVELGSTFEPKPIPERRLIGSGAQSTLDLAAFPRPTVIGETFRKRIKLLDVSPLIEEDILAVIMHPQYPLWMSVAGTLVKNPVWADVPESEIRLALETYHLGGSNPPQIMHLDVFLIRRNDELGHGQLDTYFSSDWGAYLLNFRQRLPEDKRRKRNQENAEKLSRCSSVQASSIKVRPLAGKYAISVKIHPRYKDPIVYLFAFCSVIFEDASTLPVDISRKASQNDSRPFRKWFDLGELRRDQASWSVNADVIRAIHELFTYDLGPIPVSFT